MNLEAFVEEQTKLKKKHTMEREDEEDQTDKTEAEELERLRQVRLRIEAGVDILNKLHSVVYPSQLRWVSSRLFL